MKTKEKKPALNGAVKEKKLTPKQKAFAELMAHIKKLGRKPKFA